MFTKNDLKTGMVVKTRNGQKLLVLRGKLSTVIYGTQELMFISCNTFSHGANYSLDLSCSIKAFDIVEVYSPSLHSLEATLDSPNNLIWSRDDDQDKINEEIVSKLSKLRDDIANIEALLEK